MENIIEEVKRLHRKYECLVDYADKRQDHHIEKAVENEEKYRRTGDVSYYQEKENHSNMSSRLCAEVRVYKKFKQELEEVLANEFVK